MPNIYKSAAELIGRTPLLELTHIEKHISLESLLINLHQLYERSSSKDSQHTHTEHNTGLAACKVKLIVHHTQNGKGDKVTQRLIQLRRMLCGDRLNRHIGIESHKLESPRHVCDFAHNLRVNKVADTHQTATM